MELLLIVVAFVLIPLAVLLGFGADSRDHWSHHPMHGGRRVP